MLRMLANRSGERVDSPSIVGLLTEAINTVRGLTAADNSDIYRTFCTSAASHEEFERVYTSVAMGSVGAAQWRSPVTSTSNYSVRCTSLRDHTATERVLKAGLVFNAFRWVGAGEEQLWSFYDLAYAVSNTWGNTETLSQTSSFESCVGALLSAADHARRGGGASTHSCGGFNCTTTIKRDGEEFILRVSRGAGAVTTWQSLDAVNREMLVAHALGAADAAPRLLCCVAMRAMMRPPADEHWQSYMVFEKFEGSVHSVCASRRRHAGPSVLGAACAFLAHAATCGGAPPASDACPVCEQELRPCSMCALRGSSV